MKRAFEFHEHDIRGLAEAGMSIGPLGVEMHQHPTSPPSAFLASEFLHIIADGKPLAKWLMSLSWQQETAS